VQPSRYSCEMLYIPIRSVYVPYTFPIQNRRMLSRVIRSHTFRANPSQFTPIFIECYTFLYVPCNPLAILANPYRMLYVPIRSVQTLPYFSQTGIRSNTFPIRSTYAPHIKWTFALVPTRSAHVAIPPKLQDGMHLPICLDPPTHAPKWPSLLRSYTFRYTFLYVPGGLLTFPPLAPHPIHSVSLLMRSVYASYTVRMSYCKQYTFPYVRQQQKFARAPHGPPAQRAVLVEASLHVPIISFVHRPAPLFVLRVRICLPIQEQLDSRRLTSLFWKECIRELYVPMRSVQPSRDSCEFCCKAVRSYTFRATLSRFL